MFRLLRYYALSSLPIVLAVGLLIALLYRHEANQAVIRLGEMNNLALANTLLNSVRPQLTDYLKAVADAPPQPEATLPAIPPALNMAIRDLMRDNSVVRIRIYNTLGTVVYSSMPGQTGKGQLEDGHEANTGFAQASRGRVANSLVYRDSFNSFDGTTEADNLMQTYIPVRAQDGTAIEGVFRICTDVDDQVRENERILLRLLAGASAIMAILYLALYALVRRASGIINNQHHTILERTATIEALSANMMGTEESHRKQIAYDLHEGVAQTLSAIKMSIEGSLLDDRDQRRQAGERVLPILRDAIQEVRAMATRLRPSSLDDLGLLATLDWYCREFGKQHAGVRAACSVAFREGDIPAQLKIVIYRIIDFVLPGLAEADPHARITIALMREHSDLILSIEHEPSPDWQADAMPSTAEAEERATLSGGSFYAGRNLAGGLSTRTSWPVAWNWQDPSATDNIGRMTARTPAMAELADTCSRPLMQCAGAGRGGAISAMMGANSAE